MAADDDWLLNEHRELPVQESLGLRASVFFFWLQVLRIGRQSAKELKS